MVQVYLMVKESHFRFQIQDLVLPYLLQRMKIQNVAGIMLLRKKKQAQNYVSREDGLIGQIFYTSEKTSPEKFTQTDIARFFNEEVSEVLMQVIGLEKRKIQIFEYLDNKGTLGDFLKGFVFREV